MEAPRGLGRQLVANTLHAASGRVAAILVWIVLTPWILRALGPSGYAVWSLFLAVTGYLAALDLGLAQMTLRHVAAARERGEHSESGDYGTLAIAGYAVLGLLWLAIDLIARNPVLDLLRIPDAARGDTGFAIVAGGVTFLVAGTAISLMAVAQGYGRFDIANRIALTLTIQQAIGIPLVLARGWGLRGLIANVTIGWTLCTLVALVLVARGIPAFRLSPLDRALLRWREALRFGGPVQANSVLGVVHQQIDKFLLVRFVSLAAVTPYELGFRVATAGSTFPQVLMLAIMPAASAIHAGDDPGRLQRLYDRSIRYVLSASVAILAALIGSADRLYSVWIGPGQADAALALRGLALTAFLALATGVGTAVARGVGRPDIEAWFSFIALVVHVALCLWLLPLFGLAGALMAVFAGNLVGAVYFLAHLSGVLRWARARVMLEPFGVPVLALAVGSGLGVVLDRALPAVGGVGGWAALLLIAGAAGLVALAIPFATRYVALAEARALLQRGAPAGTAS